MADLMQTFSGLVWRKGNIILLISERNDKAVSTTIWRIHHVDARIEDSDLCKDVIDPLATFVSQMAFDQFVENRRKLADPLKKQKAFSNMIVET